MSLHGPYESDNVFAKILRGEMPCVKVFEDNNILSFCLLYTSPSPRDATLSRMPSSA